MFTILLPYILSWALFCDYGAGNFIPLASMLQRIKLFLRSQADFSEASQQRGRDVKEEASERN